jgi:SAM-dependent methyltransferase
MTVEQDAFPLLIGAPADFSHVRQFLRSLPFDEGMIASVLPFDPRGRFDRERWDHTKRDRISAGLRTAIEIFFRGAALPEEDIRSAFGRETLASFRALGLLQPGAVEPGVLTCPVWLYPADGFLLASDRHDYVGTGTATGRGGVAYPALNALTAQFIHLLPAARGGDVLDLCGGCGIGALHLMRSARSAVSADITDRSTRYAEFNARLNDIAIATLRGDLYEPVQGQTFDLITAHPPFVVAVDGVQLIFRDAGDFGEAITRRVVEGLPRHLREGGACVIVCAAWDKEEPLEARVRGWLGAAAATFDVMVAEYSTAPVEEAARQVRVICANIDDDGERKLASDLRQWGARERVYGAIVIRRCAKPVDLPPLRVKLAVGATGADLQRLMDWRHLRRRPGFAQMLAQTRPRPAPQLELTVKMAVAGNALAPTQFVFQAPDTYRVGVTAETWISPWLAQFNGVETVAGMLAAAKAAGLPADLTLEQFADLVGLMAERGLLDIDLPAEFAMAEPRDAR